MPGFNGLRVLSFESRRAKEIAQLIANNGGVPIVAPSTREIPDVPHQDELKLIRGVLAGEYDVVVFMTGVGARALIDAAETVAPREEFLAALRRRSNRCARGETLRCHAGKQHSRVAERRRAEYLARNRACLRSEFAVSSAARTTHRGPGTRRTQHADV